MKLAAVAILIAAAVAAPPHSGRGPAFSGAAALELTRKAVSFGPRPSGSEPNRRLQALIRAELKPLGCEVTEDSFRASTPLGPLR